MEEASILVVDDEPNIRRMLKTVLELDGHQVAMAGSAAEARGRLERGGIDLVLLDVMLPDGTGLEVLADLRQREPDLPVVMISGHATIETAIEATRLGALDFLEKPLAGERVGLAVTNALARGRLERENRELRAQVGEEHRLVGDSRSMRELRALIERVAPTDGRVLIQGESGTGKELVARALHRLSPRAGGPFVVMNCAAVPGELIESELFGHEKGAFTGALGRRRGRFELAHHGTLFLDEIGDMPLAMQPKLLRVLEDGSVERVGGSEQIQVDVRVVAATNQDLAAKVAAGGFRADLYHRLDVLPIRLAPLRHHRDDIPVLVTHYLELTCRRHGRPPLAVREPAMAALTAYRWPGNVRELRNAVERLVIMCDGGEITAADVSRQLPALAAGGDAAMAAPADDGATTELRAAVRGFERRHILRVIAMSGGVMAEAARQLGLERSYLYRKMRDLGIEGERPGAQDG